MDAALKSKVEKLKDGCLRRLKFLARDVLNMGDWSNVHDHLEKFLDKPDPFKLIELPRGHLKSSIVTKAWSIQQMLRNPDIRILLANNTWDNSRKFLRSIQKYLEPGSMLSQLFGQFQSDHWNQDECTVKARRKILDAPTWATTGLEKEQTSQHYDLIIGDDLVARENVSTHEQREKVKLYIKDLYDLLEPNGRMVFIGTRWHQADAYADLIQDPGFDTFIRTAYKDTERTQVLFPEKFTLEKLADLRVKKGAYEFSAQYLNDPIDPSSADFDKKWIKTYDPTTAHPKYLYLMVDPAKTLSKDADYSAGTVSGKFPDGRIRVVDYFRKRCVPSELVDTIFSMVKKWKDTGYFVRVGLELFTLANLKTDLERKMREENFFFGTDGIKKMRGPQGERADVKQARIRAMQPLFEQGLVEIRGDMQSFEDELLAFPRGRTDDLIDALSLTIEKLLPSPETHSEKVVRPGTMNDLVKRIEGRLQGTAYEEFMSDLRMPA